MFPALSDIINVTASGSILTGIPIMLSSIFLRTFIVLPIRRLSVTECFEATGRLTLDVSTSTPLPFSSANAAGKNAHIAALASSSHGMAAVEIIVASREGKFMPN